MEICMESKYYLGIEEVDLEHKNLFKIINRLHSALLNDYVHDKYNTIVTILDELTEYTVAHFEHEEALMLEKKYIKYFSHKKMHDDFNQKLKTLDLKEIDADQNEYIIKVLTLGVEWIKIHIDTIDREFIEYVNARG